jgi:hypothetical protein
VAMSDERPSLVTSELEAPGIRRERVRQGSVESWPGSPVEES